MKKIYTILLGVLALLSACHDPNYVAPTAERQGFTSLKAIFTSGPFVDQEMATLTITDDNISRLVIPVPWFYPETSDDETDKYMTKVRVQAELQPNCYIEPTLTLLDLTKENHFTYTNAQGVKTPIVITGERVKSNKCELQAFALTNPEIAGVVDKSNRKVAIISAEDLSSCYGEAEVSAHATISPDPSVTPLNYNEPVEFTVTAHNGVDKAIYTVVKEVPEKIPAGFNMESVEPLFNFDPVATLGMPPYNTYIGPSLAAIGGNLIICLGDGSVPQYFNGLTGVKKGEIVLGSAEAGSVASDEADHLLIVNHAASGEAVKIYTTSSVTAEPTLFYTYTNTTGLSMGAKMKVIGNIAEDAIITITHEGIDGVTKASTFTMLLVRGGAVVTAQDLDISGAGLSWGSAPVNVGTVVAASTDPMDGCFESNYEPSQFTWVKADGSAGAALGSDLTDWALNPNCLDSKQFNNRNYVALFVVSHFPAWGLGPQLYLFDVTDKSQLTGGDVASSPALVLVNDAIDWYQTGDYSVASGDVIIAPSANGYKLYIYYYDHNSQVLGAYAADCIKK